MLVQSRFPSRLGVSALILALGACGEGPAAPESQSDLPLEASLEQMAAEANNAGDVDAAVAFSDGLLAIRRCHPAAPLAGSLGRGSQADGPAAGDLLQ